MRTGIPSSSAIRARAVRCRMRIKANASNRNMLPLIAAHPCRSGCSSVLSVAVHAEGMLEARLRVLPLLAATDDADTPC